MFPESLVHNLTLLTANPRAGATLQFLCSFRYIFPQVQVRVRHFVWYLNGMRLNPGAKARRLQINVVAPDLAGTWTSTLTFDPASAKDSGMYVTTGIYTVSQNKKLSYRRGTARCVVSVEILPIAT